MPPLDLGAICVITLGSRITPARLADMGSIDRWPVAGARLLLALLSPEVLRAYWKAMFPVCITVVLTYLYVQELLPSWLRGFSNVMLSVDPFVQSQ